MDFEVLQQRITDLEKAIEQSAIQHNQLFGRLQEALYFREQINMQKFINDNPGEIIE